MPCFEQLASYVAVIPSLALFMIWCLIDTSICYQIIMRAHTGVIYVGKPVPLDGNRTSLEKETELDGSGRNPARSGVN